MSVQRLREVALGIAALGGTLALGILTWAGWPSEDPLSVLGVLFVTGLWVAVPSLPPALAALLARSRPQAVVALLGSAAVSLFGVVVYVDALVLRATVLHALVLLAVPPIQLGIGLLALTLVGGCRIAAARRAAGHAAAGDGAASG